ncbi:Zinc finger with UFM1-specific peptidase domain protein [Porphyridium purpureum]|uniref:Zinc finger with UFM1-specific peptidase domain protein n=1 Tax=Porphyridium purpureum TaxID=35688 RepID=A0A5J4Z4S5_PORPP|nr:Zinc finger with UFM1-specific peptidase domain protein [Porphyridium purpureum]|eukprot:POR7836..scf295_1
MDCPFCSLRNAAMDELAFHRHVEKHLDEHENELSEMAAATLSLQINAAPNGVHKAPRPAGTSASLHGVRTGYADCADGALNGGETQIEAPVAASPPDYTGTRRLSQVELDEQLARNLQATENRPTENVMEQDAVEKLRAELMKSVLDALQKERAVALNYVQSSATVSNQVVAKDAGGESSSPSPVVKTKAVVDHSRIKQRKAIHVTSELDHFQTNIYGHGWDCGYKNVQTLLSALLRDKVICQHLKSKHALQEVPTVPELQARIENAWKLGFDSEGFEQLGSLFGQNKWIGALDAAALLRSLGLRACVLDFEIGDSITAKKKFLEWVFSYFENRCKPGGLGKLLASAGCPACRGTTNLSLKRPKVIPPILLQHEGHSRSIIGAEKYADGEIKLLLLDTSSAAITGLGGRRGMACLRRDGSSEELCEPRYQAVIVSIDSLYKEKELEAAKTIISEFALKTPTLY